MKVCPPDTRASPTWLALSADNQSRSISNTNWLCQIIHFLGLIQKETYTGHSIVEYVINDADLRARAERSATQIRLALEIARDEHIPLRFGQIERFSAARPDFIANAFVMPVTPP